MKTRDVVLAGAGVVVGYLLVGYVNKAKNNSQSSSSLTSDSNNDITFDCEKMWQERAKILDVIPEILLKQKEAFLRNCKEGKIEFTKDYGNGLIVTYTNDCNKVTKKCPVTRVYFNKTTWTWSKEQGKYFKRYNDYGLRPQEITEKQWIEEAISKVPF
jgi:hypothetical protein